MLSQVIHKIEIIFVRLFDNFDVGRTYLHQFQIGIFSPKSTNNNLTEIKQKQILID